MIQNQLRYTIAALVFLLFIACKSNQVVTDTEATGQTKSFAPSPHKTAGNAVSQGKGGPQFTGREVSFQSGMPCFKRYDAIMTQHGFVDNPKGVVTLKVMERMKTSSVSYDGEKMIDWMQRMMKAFPGTEPGEIGFLLVPGFLDKTFLGEVGEDPVNWPYKENRISIFVVPVKKSDSDILGKLVKGINVYSSLMMLQGGPTIWELGGVQP